MKLDNTYLIQDSHAPQMPADAIQLGAFQARSSVLGPGERAVIWVAGCLRRCPGCIKPELFSFAAGRLVEIEFLASQIQNIPNLRGVTYSGGEPFEQAHTLGKLSRLLKQGGLDILVYTGYTLAALRKSPERFSPLLEVADYIVDGEYRQDLPGPFQWRGSANQTLYDLRRGTTINDTIASPHREVELSFGGEELIMTGFPSPAFVSALHDQLAIRGINLVALDERD